MLRRLAQNCAQPTAATLPASSHCGQVALQLSSVPGFDPQAAAALDGCLQPGPQPQNDSSKSSNTLKRHVVRGSGKWKGLLVGQPQVAYKITRPLKAKLKAALPESRSKAQG